MDRITYYDEQRIPWIQLVSESLDTYELINSEQVVPDEVRLNFFKISVTFNVVYLCTIDTSSIYGCQPFLGHC